MVEVLLPCLLSFFSSCSSLILAEQLSADYFIELFVQFLADFIGFIALWLSVRIGDILPRLKRRGRMSRVEGVKRGKFIKYVISIVNFKK